MRRWRATAELYRWRSENTVGRHIGLLEESYLLFSMKRYSAKVCEQSKANRKVYAVDTGMATAVGFALRLSGTCFA